MIVAVTFLSISCAHAMNLDLTKQDDFKKICFSKDGVSLHAIEQELREKYKNVTIPPIKVVYNLPAKYNIAMAGYHLEEHKLLIDSQDISNLNASSWKWLMLHETGHAQMPLLFQLLVMVPIYHRL